MSYQDALADNIPMGKAHNGMNVYYPPCRFCGTPVRVFSYRPTLRFACADCKKEAVAQERAENAQRQSSVKVKKLEQAIKRISKVADIADYQRGIDYVRKNLNKPYWFGSTEEMMVALELMRRGVTAHHQVKVFEYRVDFILPDLKVALEVDGKIYHGKDKEKQQQIRDNAVCYKLGEDWQVIRIDTENINTDVTKLMRGIYGVMAYRKRKSVHTSSQ